jgi:hypothetical protein
MNNKLAQPSDVICINILVPRAGVRSCLVSLSTAIEALAEQYSISKANWVFNGQVLDPKSTLGLHGIQNNDAVVLVPVNGAADRWMRVTREADAFSDTVQFAIGKESRMDFLRIKDLRASRLECRPRAFRKFTANQSQTDTPDVIRYATIIGETPSELSCNPLPVCW